MSFKEDGSRFEKILYSPISTLQGLSISRKISTISAASTRLPSNRNMSTNIILPSSARKRSTSSISMSSTLRRRLFPNPKKTNLKYFQRPDLGRRSGSDDRQIKRKAVPEGKDMNGLDQRFPVMETWRDSVDGKYWFPVLSTSDDELVFNSGQVVQMKVARQIHELPGRPQRRQNSR